MTSQSLRSVRRHFANVRPAVRPSAAWTAFSVIVIGFAIAAGITALVSYIVSSQNASDLTQTGGPGLALTAAACCLSLVAAVLGAVAGCKLGPLPGVGEGSCCCPAHRPIGATTGMPMTSAVIVGSVAKAEV